MAAVIAPAVLWLNWKNGQYLWDRVFFPSVPLPAGARPEAQQSFRTAAGTGGAGSSTLLLPGGAGSEVQLREFASLATASTCCAGDTGGGTCCAGDTGGVPLLAAKSEAPTS